MFEILVSDVLRLAHLLAVAVGFGAAVETEIFMLKRRKTIISRGLMSGLGHRHTVILYALGAMWITGLALVALRTGFLLDAFTPKLWAKITVVTILSVNAMFVASVAIPILNGHAGKRISALPRTARRALFAVAGVSAASWLMAMVMGSSVLLKTAPAWLFQSALPLSYVLGIVIATLVGERLYARPMAARSQSAPFAQSARKPAPTPDVHAPAAKARRPAPPRAAVTVPSPGAPPPDRSGVARHMPGEALRTPPATSPAKQPSQHADPAPVAAQARKRPPAAKIKPPKVELRASDLAIAFPQKLKRGPRLKADPDGATGQRSAQAVTRARLLDVAAELQRTSS